MRRHEIVIAITLATIAAAHAALYASGSRANLLGESRSKSPQELARAIPAALRKIRDSRLEDVRRKIGVGLPKIQDSRMEEIRSRTTAVTKVLPLLSRSRALSSWSDFSRRSLNRPEGLLSKLRQSKTKDSLLSGKHTKIPDQKHEASDSGSKTAELWSTFNQVLSSRAKKQEPLLPAVGGAHCWSVQFIFSRTSPSLT